MQGPLSEGYSVAMEQQLGKQGEGTQRDCGRVEKKKKEGKFVGDADVLLFLYVESSQGITVLTEEYSVQLTLYSQLFLAVKTVWSA